MAKKTIKQKQTKKKQKKSELPGVPFEKAVAAIQAQFDPKASVTHNEVIKDRLGHHRQFDVVIRGSFAGQELLGVIECKDHNKKVGSPDIDAFVTKSQEINANVRLFMSRRGFTQPALEKCKHYGIQPLSLLGKDAANLKLSLGTRWEAERQSWRGILVTLKFVDEGTKPNRFRSDQLTIHGKRVLDWITNYILAHEHEVDGYGWVMGIGVEFSAPQTVDLGQGESVLCRGIEFQAERICEKFERLVGWSGTGFYDWNAEKATFPPGSTVETEPISMDFSQWLPVAEGATLPSGFMTVHFFLRAIQFEHVTDALDLAAL